MISAIAAEPNGCSDLPKSPNAFLSAIVHCSDDLFDWLSLRELAALNSTCKRLQEWTNDYVHRKYPMKYMKIGQIRDIPGVLYQSKDESMQAFAKNVRSLVVIPSTECFRYLRTQHCKNVVSLAFYDGQFSEDDIIYMAPLLEHAEIIEIQYCCIHGEFHENLLKHCRNIKQLVIKYGFDECEHSGRPNRWIHQTYPTLEHFHWSASPLPDNLETFFRQNQNIRSFNAGVYTTMCVIEFLLRTATSVNELHVELTLELNEDENEAMAMIRSGLNTLYERNQFKELMLEFDFRTLPLDSEWSTLAYLTGAYFDLSHWPGSTKALLRLIHLKLLALGINTILSAAKAYRLSKSLQNLEEIYIQVDAMHAIIPFARNAVNLQKIYVYRIEHEHAFRAKKIKRHFVYMLNEYRTKLYGACKMTIYLPDQAYVQIKCQSNDCLTQSLVEIKRSESHVVKHPFAATKIRKDICELYEIF